MLSPNSKEFLQKRWALCATSLAAIRLIDTVVAPIYLLPTKGHPMNEINPEEASGAIEQAPNVHDGSPVNAGIAPTFHDDTSNVQFHYIRHWKTDRMTISALAAGEVLGNVENKMDIFNVAEPPFFEIQLNPVVGMKENIGAERVLMYASASDATPWLLNAVVNREVRKELRRIRWLLLLPYLGLAFYILAIVGLVSL